MSLLPQEEIDAALVGDLDAWHQEGDTLAREVEANSFLGGVALVQRVAEAAEAADHHPDIDIRYTTLTFRLSTHSEGGISGKDVELAGVIDQLASGS